MPRRRFLAALVLAAAPAAGQSFEPQFRDSTALFIGLFAVDSNVVWAAGTGGRVARTTDGGATWTVTRVPGAEELQFRDVHAFGPDEAFVLSIGNDDQSRIYHTTDGGATWRLSFLNHAPEAFFDCFSFWDETHGIAFSDSHEGEFFVIRTSDGGETWEDIAPSVLPDARPGEGGFAASGTCVVTRPRGHAWIATGASGVDTRVLGTDDYGATWWESVTPVASRSGTEGLTSLAFWSDREGIAFGATLQGPDSTYANVITTADGGRTWALTGGQALEGIVYGGAVLPGAAAPSAVAVSPRGMALSTDGGRTWRRIGDADTWTVTFLSPTVGWAVGRGHISRYRPAR